MGGKKKAEKKKKGLGAEKTAQKTEKKLSAKMRKELALQGEEDIETLVARFSAEDAKKSCKTITEIPLTDRPSKRSNFSLVAHPNKDQLLMFGGECIVNKSTTVYSDFLCFDIKKQKWTQWECSGGPPPRAAHQAVTIAGDGGQMWMFGGEFVTPSESQFYHYRDLWVFHFKDRRWEKIEVKGGPSGRSGHRMVVLYTPNLPPRVAIFGGFHDSLRGDCRYYNDFYIFDLSERLWRKLEITGTPPAPRSGHLMAALNDGRIYIHGGFSKVKAPSKKKGFDDETGVVHADSFFLTPDKRDTTGTKFKWIQAKTTGSVPSKRCSSTLVAWTESGKNSALVFGGVHDDEEQEVLSDSSDEEEEVSTVQRFQVSKARSNFLREELFRASAVCGCKLYDGSGG
ncbi:unnamed protein product [Notodromas monacha]|uniref:Kelch repeat-containing protein n=1 Tax=Notodromas monacha TaxID=399045 RepID=A0A7R9BSW5_9CRUS|nr:unnamed protein product [Notodromas monacha]CAG0919746.1 unnamed protein product [Notodromas monacha]